MMNARIFHDLIKSHAEKMKFRRQHSISMENVSKLLVKMDNKIQQGHLNHKLALDELRAKHHEEIQRLNDHLVSVQCHHNRIMTNIKETIENKITKKGLLNLLKNFVREDLEFRWRKKQPRQGSITDARRALQSTPDIYVHEGDFLESDDEQVYSSEPYVNETFWPGEKLTIEDGAILNADGEMVGYMEDDGNAIKV